VKRRSGGFTLLELIVVTAVCAVLVAAASPAVFTVLTGTENNSNRVTALTQVQNVGAQMSRDAMQATAVDVSKDTGFPVTLSWGDMWYEEGKSGPGSWVSVDHYVTYALVGNELRRQERMLTSVFSETGEQQGPTIEIDSDSLVSQYLTAATASKNGGVLSVSATARFPLSGGRYVAEETRNYEITPRVE